MAGEVFVVAGPSGAGKDTLIRRALEEVEGVDYSVSATTRAPRGSEVDGEDYHFITDERFEELLAEDGFLEWEEVFGRRYGTLRSEVEKAQREGRGILLEIDVKGALRVKSEIADAVLIFIEPPSLKELEERLRKRNLDDEEEIERRTQLAPWEIEVGRVFDRVIVNDDADRAAGELARVLSGEKG